MNLFPHNTDTVTSKSIDLFLVDHSVCVTANVFRCWCD